MCKCKKSMCKNCSCVKKYLFCTDDCNCSENCLARKPELIESDNQIFKLGKFLGKGTYGAVYELNDTQVVKISSNEKAILKEYKLYKRLFPDTNVLLINKIQCLYGLILPKFYKFDYENLPFECKQKALLGLVNVLRTFHNKGFCHGDIKPDNIMFMNSNCTPESITFIDLNLTTRINKSYKYVRGNLAYCSPRTQEFKEFQPIDDLISILFLSQKILYGKSMKWGNDKVFNKYNFIKEHYPNLSLETLNHDKLEAIINEYS